jgi:hypothetical protein
VRIFTLIDSRHLLIAFSLGVVAAMAIYLAFRFTSAQHSEAANVHNPVPPLLILVIAGFLIWFVIYVVFFGLQGRPF